MKYIVSLFALGALLFGLSGCQTAAPTRVNADDRPATIQRAQPITPATTATVQAPVRFTSSESSDVILKTNQIRVTKTVLQQASVGKDLKYRIQIKALDDISTVRVTENIPTGLKYLSSDPAGSFVNNTAKWTFTSMAKDQVQNIDVTAKPLTEGTHEICSTISVDNSFCINIFSGQPKLDVVKQGPATVELGEEVTWIVTVTNSGSAEANNVIVTDKLPDAFKPTTDLRHVIGTLAPGETKSVEYSAKAIKQGEFRNHAVASYDGGPDIAGESSAPISVVQSGIRIRKTGPSEAYVFKPVIFEITIENTGDTALKNVRITDILPAGSSVIDNGLGRVSGNAIGWMIPNLPAGASQLIKTEIAATRKGESTNTVKALTANGLEARDAVTTDWLAVPGVTISITDQKDPIRVSESTTYSIQVRNQGDFEPVSGTVTVSFNDSIKPTAVAGDAQGKIEGQTVTFPRTTLEPGKDINLSIIAEGGKIGPGRVVLKFSADFLSDPIISQEATNVY
jgi:uncharacterized repeat protein (TIGR01451 family)